MWVHGYLGVQRAPAALPRADDVVVREAIAVIHLERDHEAWVLTVVVPLAARGRHDAEGFRVDSVENGSVVVAEVPPLGSSERAEGRASLAVCVDLHPFSDPRRPLWSRVVSFHDAKRVIAGRGVIAGVGCCERGRPAASEGGRREDDRHHDSRRDQVVAAHL